jgi:hypothetical protein
MRPERDRPRERSLPDAATAAVTSIAVSRPAPIAHHQKKTNTDAISRPSPSPTPKAPALAAHGRRPNAASNRSRRRQRPPTRSASPPSSGTRATTSIRANPCPGLSGTSTGPSKRAGTANSTKARANRIPHPCSHLMALPLSKLGPDDAEQQPHSADSIRGDPPTCRALLGGLGIEATGYRGPASPSGRAGDRCRQARLPAEQAELLGMVDRLASGRDAELSIDRERLGLHRVLRDEQPLANLPEAQVAGQQRQQAQLGGSKR